MKNDIKIPDLLRCGSDDKGKHNTTMRNSSLMGGTIDLSILNKATGQPSIQIAVAATLLVSLTNSLGVDLDLAAGNTPSILQVFLPDTYFSPAQQQLMYIDLKTMPAWTSYYDNNAGAITLKYTENAGLWQNGAILNFGITNVSATGSPDSAYIFINPNNIGKDSDNVPSQLNATLTIEATPSGTKPKLTDILQVTLENQGQIYVSTSDKDTLSNALYLNLKNIGTTPLYSGSQRPITPQVSAWFDYGSDAGDIAPDDNPSKPPPTSAWSIKGRIAGQQKGSSWGIDGPGTDKFPVWSMSPTNTNVEVLGAGDSANITFAFEEIISVTPTGHTQIHVAFSDFYKDQNTPYDAGDLSLDIVKTDAPPTRGLVNLFSKNGVLFEISSADQPTVVDLWWRMTYVAKVNIVSSYPGMPVVTRLYPDADALNKDSFQLILPGMTQSGPVVITVQAFDAQGGYLNSLQVTVFVTSNVFIDPRDGTSYPIVQLGNHYWMAHNLNYNYPSANPWSAYYNNSNAYGPDYGRLYAYTSDWHVPEGWRMPIQDDWDEIIKNYGFAALFEEGSTGFNAKAGGYYNAAFQNFQEMHSRGYYWTATPNGPQHLCACVDAVNKTLTTGAAYPTGYGCSVRYVKDI